MNNLRKTNSLLALAALVVIIAAGVYLIVFLQGKIRLNSGAGAEYLTPAIVVSGDECDMPEDARSKDVQITIRTVDVDEMKKRVADLALKYTEAVGPWAMPGYESALINTMSLATIILPMNEGKKLLEEIKTSVKAPNEIDVSSFDKDSAMLKQECEINLGTLKTLQIKERAYLDRIKVASGEELKLLLDQLTTVRQESQNFTGVFEAMDSRIGKIFLNISIMEFLG